ncbi:MAG: hypothetical protein WCO06_06845 [Candidatus Roizmanbacteria bacterium]
MQHVLDAYEVVKNGIVYDYRLGVSLNLKEVKGFFEQKGYIVISIKNETRHVTGILQKNSIDYFFKLATTQGMTIISEIEAKWNEVYNQTIKRDISSFWVPKNVDSGYFKEELFYLVTEYFDGQLLVDSPRSNKDVSLLNKHINTIIDFSLDIQKLQLPEIVSREIIISTSHWEWFINKTKTWLDSTPIDVQERFKLTEIFSCVQKRASILKQGVRHGDFAPWHMLELKNRKLGLIDGEHALTHGVEYYDICFFIQRVYSVLQNTDIANQILSSLIKKNVDIQKLQTVLFSRAIGGFLDESLSSLPDYSIHQKFIAFVKGLEILE